MTPKTRLIQSLQIFIIAIGMNYQILSQSLDLPLTDNLENSLISYYDAERDAKLKAFDAGKSSDWQDLLPRVGVGYTVSNAVRPTVSWSPLSIFTRRDSKKKAKLSRQSIVLSYENIISGHLFKLRQQITDYNLDRETLEAMYKELKIDEQLYDITEARYQENLIKPSEYLREQKRILKARTHVDNNRKILLKQKSTILFTAKFTQ